MCTAIKKEGERRNVECCLYYCWRKVWSSIKSRYVFVVLHNSVLLHFFCQINKAARVEVVYCWCYEGDIIMLFAMDATCVTG